MQGQVDSSYTRPSYLCWQFVFKKSLHILEGGASGVQICDIEQVIVLIFFKCDKIH